MRWLFVALCAVGCAPQGLALEVTTSDPEIKRVELFVGSECDAPDCPTSVAPPGLTAKSTNVFLVADPKPWPAQVVDGHAGFELDADTDQTVPILVAVGFDAVDGGSARAVASLYHVPVPASDAIHWQMPLSAAAVLDNQPPATDAVRVAVWQQPRAPDLRCVMVEHGPDKRDLVVPKGDTDCDLLPAGECAPWANLATNAPAPFSAANCLFRTTDRAVQVCMLGGPTCSETGGGTISVCAALAEEACLPDAFCTACPQWDTACITTQVANANGVTAPSVGCQFPTTLEGGSCAGGETRQQIDARPFLGNSTARCRDVSFNVVGMTPGPFSHSLTIGSATFAIKNVSSECRFDLVVSGTVSTGVPVQPLLLDLALDNAKHLVLPLTVTYLANRCAELPLCTANVTTDSMFACAEAKTYLKCQAQTAGCGGPDCGSSCCSTGEQCVNGQCQCGTGPGCGPGFECAKGPIGEGCGSMCCGLTGPLCDF